MDHYVKRWIVVPITLLREGYSYKTVEPIFFSLLLLKYLADTFYSIFSVNGLSLFFLFFKMKYRDIVKGSLKNEKMLAFCLEKYILVNRERCNICEKNLN